MRRRLHGLGPQAATVARAVAVVGDGATVPEVAALCDCEEAAVRAAAVDLTATDLLLSDARLAFVHPLVRAAVYEDMAAVQRAALHRQVAALREATGDPEQIAVHLLHVEPRSDSSVVDVLRAAGAEAAGRGAPDAAATFLRRALAEPPQAGPSRAAVLVELGYAEALARMDGFEEHLSEAIAELDDVDEAAEVALSLGRALCTLGNGKPALKVIEAALETVDPGGAMGLLLEAELLGFAYAFADLRPRVSDRVNSRLRRLERGEQVDPVVLGALSPWLLENPPVERAVQAAEAALADDRLSTPAVSTFIWPVVGYTLLGAGRLTRAAEVFDAAVDAARRRGEQLMLGLASTCRSNVSYLQGEVVRAEGEARVGWELAIGEGMVKASEPWRSPPRGRCSSTRWSHGASSTRPSAASTVCRCRCPSARSCSCLPGPSCDWRREGRTRRSPTFAPSGPCSAKSSISRSKTGAPGLRSCSRVPASARRPKRWPGPSSSRHSAGKCHWRSESRLPPPASSRVGPRGSACLEQAVATLDRTEGRLDHARALIELGALLRRSGSGTAAREPLRQGMDLAARCGATAYADRAHSELVAAGARPRRDRRFLTGPESLTPGELRVATLAAEGLTDRVIAQRLFVTQAAVQFHLRNTFRKLEIGARGDLAAALDGTIAGKPK